MPSWGVTSHTKKLSFSNIRHLSEICLFGKDTLNKLPGERVMVLYWLKKADCALNIIQ